MFNAVLGYVRSTSLSRGISSETFTATMSGSGSPEVATFASGCFWGVEHIFLKHFPPKEDKGILKTAVGYTGGKADSQNPDYKTVCTGATDHAEAVRIEFDPSIVKYEELVGECAHTPPHLKTPHPTPYTIPRGLNELTMGSPEFFYRTHDPTTVNRQGHDTGTRTQILLFSGPFSPISHPLRHISIPRLSSAIVDTGSAEYRSAIFFNTPDQEEIAKRVTAEVQKKHFDPHGTKIVTQILPAGPWWDAEEYHQLYLFKNPSGYQCANHRLHW
ncbi:hypothetical protein GSI_11430 [Ganoderma sinense ZZ0214-1]|uniref:peptide-methionine (S)-S-oxide reductase n=1 Tax=Ganoderma sinense ZZ0214-1 TaxID=1077348 RepID=A0A2G8RVZ0_9APHY|nr:hypothetical protein GSI_11430 [Ganoderma sinense ZZ0214-1]